MTPVRSHKKSKNYLHKALIFKALVALLTSVITVGCVVKEELDDTYNQAHLGLNEWSLLPDVSGAYQLSFDAGYLIGLVDQDGVDAITWTYELMNRDQEVYAFTSEEMRAASPEKTQIFVEGKRERVLNSASRLQDGETYILWFTLEYKGDILHEQLFPLIAGQQGGNPNWIDEFIEERTGGNAEELVMTQAMETTATTDDGAIGPLDDASDEESMSTP